MTFDQVTDRERVLLDELERSQRISGNRGWLLAVLFAAGWVWLFRDVYASLFLALGKALGGSDG